MSGRVLLGVGVVAMVLGAVSTIATPVQAQPLSYETIRNLEYARPDGRAQLLDLYVPEGSGPFPLVVWIHGGGWSGGDKSLGAQSSRVKQATRGFVVASVNYRLSGVATFPAQIEDVKAAIRWLRSNAARYKVDPARVGAWGSSAGGHLAALLGTSGDVADLEGTVGTTGPSSRIQAAVDWFGPSDLLTIGGQALPCSVIDHDAAGSPESKLLGCAVQSCKDAARRASPVTYVTADDPPFLIFHGTADCSVPPLQSQQLHDALVTGGVTSSLRLLDGAGHGGAAFESAESTAIVESFLDRSLKGAASPAFTWIFPSSAHLAGQGGSFYTTDVVVASTGTADTAFTLKYLGHDADGWGGPEKSFSLGAGRSVTVADVLASLFPGGDYGAIRLSSTSEALAAVALTSTPASSGGTFGQSVSASSSADWIRPGTPKTLVSVREDAAFRTNLVLANAGEAEIDVDVSLVGSEGVTLGTKRYRLPALGMRQVTRVVRDLGVTVDVAGARLVLSTPTADGAFAAYASVIDGTTNDPHTLLPVGAGGSQTATSAARALVFALTNSGDAGLASLLDHTGVDGVALQEGWANIEVRKDEYAFTALGGAIEKAKARGKRVSLHLLASPRAPEWLAGVGAAYYTGTDIRGNSVRDVVPWDPVYLDRYGRFLRAVAQHLGERATLDTIFDVSVVVPVAEMNLVACRGGKLGDTLAYDRSKYLSAWKQMLDAFHGAFPQTAKFVSPAVNDLICAPERDASFYREVMGCALETYGPSFWVFAADLNADGSQRTRDYLDVASRTSLGYQTIWSATSDPSNRMGGAYPGNLAEAVRKGLSNGASYFEIYAADVRNPEPAIQEAIRIARGTAASSVTWIVPSSAHLAGQGGSFYTTDLVVANTGTADAAFTLKYLGHDVDGRDGAERSFSLGAGKSATYADILASVYSGADYGSIRLSSTADALAAVALTSTPAPTGGTFGQSVPAFTSGDWIRTGAPKSLVGVREDGAFRTNLVLANAGEAEVDVDVSLVGSDGADLGTRRYRLPALGMHQVTRVVRDLGVNVDVAGARLVLSTPTADGVFSAYASVIDATTNDPRTLLPR